MAYKKNQLVKGLLWSGLDKFGFVLIQLILDYILIQLLSPKDYGAIGAILIITSFFIIFAEGGFGNALIRKLDRTEEDYATVFFSNVLVSVILYLFIFLFSPLVEVFFRIDNLSIILRWVGLIIIFNAFTMVHRTKLSIALNYKLQAQVSIVSVIISGVISVYMAFHGYGVWALAIQIILMNFLNSVLLWMFFPWFPMFVFSIKSLKSLFGFGSKIMISSILQSLFFNAYPIVIGRFIGSTALGLYSKANQFSQMPSSVLSNVLQRVLFPFFSIYQDDNQKIVQLHQIYTKIVAIVIMPFFFILSFFIHFLVDQFFNEDWRGISNLLFMLLIAYSFYPLIVQNMMLLQVKNKTSLFLKTEIAVKILGLIILLLSIPYGVKGVVLGILVHLVLQFIISSVVVQRILGENIFGQLTAMFPVLGISAFLLSLLFFGGAEIQKYISEFWLIFLLSIVFLYFIVFFIFYRRFYYDVKDIFKEIKSQ